MENTNSVDKKALDRRSVAAILLIVAGAILFLETFDIVDINLKYYIFSWKTLLIGIGLVIVTSSNNKIPGYILMGLGFMFWIPSFFDYNIQLFQVFWPIVLIAVGLIIISRRNKHDNFMRGMRSDKREEGAFQSDYLDDVSIFGGGVKRFASQNFKGGNLTAVFGGSEVDLVSAQMSERGAVIDMFIMFGGTKLIVPGSWQVKSETTSLFGGLSDKRHIKPDQLISEKVLLIKGIVLFGGVEIKNY